MYCAIVNWSGRWRDECSQEKNVLPVFFFTSSEFDAFLSRQV